MGGLFSLVIGGTTGCLMGRKQRRASDFPLRRKQCVEPLPSLVHPSHCLCVLADTWPGDQGLLGELSWQVAAAAFFAMHSLS